MIRTLLGLAPVSALLVGAILGTPAPAEVEDVAPSQQEERLADTKATVTKPTLYIEGQPFWAEVQIEVETGAELPAECPTYLLEPAAWRLDGKSLDRRRSADSVVRLAPSQTLRTRLDLSSHIEAVLEDDPRDFRLQFDEAETELRDTIYLARPETGLVFTTLPQEQLDGYQVVLDTTSGYIWIELWPDVAPNHVRNFLDLCWTGFYDGIPFHRVIPGYMIQGGRAREGQSAPRKVPAEFSNRPHEAGVLSAARLSGDIHSASSEFFIVHHASRQLDGKYTAFGRVLNGMDAVDQIARGAEVHAELIRKMQEMGIRIDTQDDYFDFVVNEPNPPQLIRQALVVKASKSRPDAPEEDDERR